MGDVGTKSGIAFDAYVLDTLMPDLVGHDRAPSAFIVYLWLWRVSIGAGEPSVSVSLRDLADGTGLSKRGVQDALTVLAQRKLLRTRREGITEVPRYTVLRPWIRTAG